MAIRHPLLLLIRAPNILSTAILLIGNRRVPILILKSRSNSQTSLFLAKLAWILLLLDVVLLAGLVRTPHLIVHDLFLTSHFGGVHVLISHSLHTNATSTTALLLNHRILLIHKLRVHHVGTLLVIC